MGEDTEGAAAAAALGDDNDAAVEEQPNRANAEAAMDEMNSEILLEFNVLKNGPITALLDAAQDSLNHLLRALERRPDSSLYVLCAAQLLVLMGSLIEITTPGGGQPARPTEGDGAVSSSQGSENGATLTVGGFTRGEEGVPEMHLRAAEDMVYRHAHDEIKLPTGGCFPPSAASKELWLHWLHSHAPKDAVALAKATVGLLKADGGSERGFHQLTRLLAALYGWEDLKSQMDSEALDVTPHGQLAESRTEEVEAAYALRNADAMDSAREALHLSVPSYSWSPIASSCARVRLWDGVRFEVSSIINRSVRGQSSQCRPLYMWRSHGGTTRLAGGRRRALRLSARRRSRQGRTRRFGCFVKSARGLFFYYAASSIHRRLTQRRLRSSNRSRAFAGRRQSRPSATSRMEGRYRVSKRWCPSIMVIRTRALVAVWPLASRSAKWRRPNGACVVR